jgi:hypothetical protein
VDVGSIFETGAIIDRFRDVHRALGFGYREYVYALAIERDLVAKDIRSIARSL